MACLFFVCILLQINFASSLFFLPSFHFSFVLHFMDKDKIEKECKKQVSIDIQVVKHSHSSSLATTHHMIIGEISIILPRNWLRGILRFSLLAYIAKQKQIIVKKFKQFALHLSEARQLSRLFSIPLHLPCCLLALSVFLVFRLSLLTHTLFVARRAQRAQLIGDCLPLPPPASTLALLVFVVPLTTHTHTLRWYRVLFRYDWQSERVQLKLIVSLKYKRILSRAPQFVFHLQSRRFTADLALTSYDSVV